MLRHAIDHIPPQPRPAPDTAPASHGAPPGPAHGPSPPPTSRWLTGHPPLPALTGSPTMPPSLPPVPALPPPSPPPAPPCVPCLAAMLALAGVAGLFAVLSALLGERLFRAARARGVPSVWRRGGALWIEPAAPPQPDGAPQAEAGELWIPRPTPGAEDWYRGPTGSTAALWDAEAPAWGAQPHVTLQDISDFFRRGGGGLGRGP
ncbi:transmembrane protein C16orf54 homolog [Caretta caretta]|uniref:transmembrane protein C16orf54 homolog n=1 Tax=Caretta caretta TaxID=8467 RepID=UPI003F4BDAD7